MIVIWQGNVTPFENKTKFLWLANYFIVNVCRKVGYRKVPVPVGVCERSTNRHNLIRIWGTVIKRNQLFKNWTWSRLAREKKKIIIESIQTGRQWPSLFQWSRIIFLFRETSVGSRPLHNTPKNSPRYVIERIIYIIRVDGSFPLELARKTWPMTIIARHTNALIKSGSGGWKWKWKWMSVSSRSSVSVKGVFGCLGCVFNRLLLQSFLASFHFFRTENTFVVFRREDLVYFRIRFRTNDFG